MAGSASTTYLQFGCPLFYPASNSVFRNLIQLLFQADAPGI